jgi:predicted nucleic acid-binding Zn ribbon protein
VSVATPAPASTDAGAPQWGIPPQEVCPLCATPLKPEQDWCLRCGTGARTRLAAPAKWKALVIALALIVVLSLGVLTAALVTLAG